ncbi:hypothetical protein ACTXHP_04805 [Bacillus stercoris]|uniref:hypothetical protein n=1 Tax=Bacillus stercoris TaxID=2054641 RepID=UPI0040464AD4
MAQNPISQEEANKILKNNLTLNDQKEYSDLAQILESHFPGATTGQCAGLIHRAHTKDDGVLIKKGKFYSLRSKEDTLSGIEKAKQKIKNLINEIDKIPVSEFQTANDFEDFKKIRNALQTLAK